VSDPNRKCDRQIFRDVFELALSDRRVLEGRSSVEIATFQCASQFPVIWSI
jgi:hypothetical protein